MILEILIGVGLIGIVVIVIDSYLIKKRIKKMNKENKKFNETISKPSKYERN